MHNCKTIRITINQDSIQENYKTLSTKCANVAAVVKADAYGIGVDYVVPILNQVGAKFFYVANFDEALSVRKLTNSPIAVLNGLPKNAALDYAHYKIIPVLNSVSDVENCPAELPSIWHIDTGMNRLGLNHHEIDIAVNKTKSLPILMMTHLASADDINSDFSKIQVTRFDTAIQNLPKPFTFIPQSICNSSGIFRNNAWHREQVRAGIAIYGGNPTNDTTNPMHRVIEIGAKILQIKQIHAGETVGYNQTYTATHNTKIAIIGIGYADGLLPYGGNHAKLYWHCTPCPIIGRISMDLIAVDIGGITTKPPQIGDYLEIIGAHQSIEELASDLGTINYEILTLLTHSARAEKILTSMTF